MLSSEERKVTAGSSAFSGTGATRRLSFSAFCKVTLSGVIDKPFSGYHTSTGQLSCFPPKDTVMTVLPFSTAFTCPASSTDATEGSSLFQITGVLASEPAALHLSQTDPVVRSACRSVSPQTPSSMVRTIASFERAKSYTSSASFAQKGKNRRTPISASTAMGTAAGILFFAAFFRDWPLTLSYLPDTPYKASSHRRTALLP